MYKVKINFKTNYLKIKGVNVQKKEYKEWTKQKTNFKIIILWCKK